MSDDARVQQFRQMVQADPENDLGHFSLGKACLERGLWDEAVTALTRTLELNPRMSKAFQLLGDALDRAGRRDEAVKIVTQGITTADAQGDRMPRDAMADMLRVWGIGVPAFKGKAGVGTSADSSPSVDSGFTCSRCGCPGVRLTKPPFKGELGAKIHERVCETCWREWIPTGTKVINELGLALSSREGQDTYDQYMVDFLQLHD